VKREESHAGVYSLSDLLYKLVVDLFVIGVSPPHKNIGVLEKLVGYSLVGIVEGGEGELNVLAFKHAFEISVNTFGIKCFCFRLSFFVPEFMPKCNSDGHRNLQNNNINKLYNKSHIKSIYKTTKNQQKRRRKNEF